MDSSTQPTEASQPPVPQSTAEKIQAINSIDESVPQLLAHASSAISALSSHPVDGPDTSIEGHKKAFSDSTTAYFTLVRKIKADLETQANLIETALASAESTQSAGEREDLGPLDIGRLKSRLHGGELDVESRVWAEARKMLEQEKGK